MAAEVASSEGMTGLRVGELRFLTKADVDLEQGLVCVRAKEIKETGERWKPKHGNERIAPLSAKAREIVERHLTAATAPWVFEAPSGHGSKGGRFEYQRIRQALRRAKKAAGVEQGKVHSFRHAFCSHLAQQPHVTAFDAMKLMGHASLDIVVVYFHTTKERLCSVMSKVSFDSMLEGVPALSATSSPTE